MRKLLLLPVIILNWDSVILSLSKDRASTSSPLHFKTGFGKLTLTIVIMKNPFTPGDQLTFSHTVTGADVAKFESGTVHEVYSTFALGRDAEWSGRLFVLQMKEEGEEGIGAALSIEHNSPAFVGSEVLFTSEFLSCEGNRIFTKFTATVGDRIIASGLQTQKIVAKEKLDAIFNSIKNKG